MIYIIDSKTQIILNIWASDLYGHMFYFIYIPKYSVYFVFCCQRFPDDKVRSLSEHNWISVTRKCFLSFAGSRPWKRSHYIYHPERRSKQRLWSLPNVSCHWKAGEKAALPKSTILLALNKQKKDVLIVIQALSLFCVALKNKSVFSVKYLCIFVSHVLTCTGCRLHSDTNMMHN